MHRRLHEFSQHGVVIDDLHGPSAQDIRRAHNHRISNGIGHYQGFIDSQGDAVPRLFKLQLLEHLLEPLAIFGQVDGIRRGPKDGGAGLLQRNCEIERGLPAELNDHPERLLRLENVQDILARERFEVELIGRVVVGGNGFRIGVDHDRFDVFLPQREGRVNTAVVEFDALADAVGAATQDHHLGTVGGPGFVFRFVGGIVIGSVGFKFGRTGIHQFVDRFDAVSEALLPHRFLVHAAERCQSDIREAPRLGETESLGIVEERPGFGRLANVLFHVEQLFEVIEKPRINGGQMVDFSNGQPQLQGFTDLKEALGIGAPQTLFELFEIVAADVGRWVAESIAADLERTDGLLERFLEGAPDGHGFTHGFHGGRQEIFGFGELFEGEAGHLDDAVVDGGLE